MKASSTRRLAALLLAYAGAVTSTLLAPLAQASGTLLVLNKGSLSLVTVDPASLKVTASYPSGPDPHEVVASADGRLAYLTNYTAGNTISVVNLVEKKVLPPIELGALRRPHGLEFTGGNVYFTAEGSKVVGRYNPNVRKIDWVMGTGQDRTHMITVSSDLKRVFATNEVSASVSIFEQVEAPDRGRPPGAPSRIDWKVTTVPVGKGVEGVSLSPDGKELWVLNAQDASVTILDPDAKKVVETVPVAHKSGNRLKFTPDGKHVFIDV